MDNCVIYQDRQFRGKKRENEESHTEFQVGQPGGDVHEAIDNIGLECIYNQIIDWGVQKSFDNDLPSINCPFLPL